MTDNEIKSLIAESVLTIKGYVDAVHQNVNIRIDSLELRFNTLESKVDTLESKVDTIIDILKNGVK